VGGSVRRALVEAVILRAHSLALFPPCFPRRSGGHIFTRSRPLDAGKQKVEESDHLCWREVARRVICVEWVVLLRPVRQDLDNAATHQSATSAHASRGPPTVCRSPGYARIVFHTAHTGHLPLGLAHMCRPIPEPHAVRERLASTPA